MPIISIFWFVVGNIFKPSPSGYFLMRVRF